MKEKATTLAVQRLVIVLAVLAVLGQIASHEFVGFDDPNTIYRNPRFNPPTVDNILYYWSHDEGLLYIPVTYTAWGLVATVARVESPDVTGSSQNPWLFHALNVLLHLGAALLVFEWLRVILRVNWPACVGALVFALHPLQVETVAWASGTKDLLCGFFVTATLWAYLTARNDESSPRSHKGMYALATACYVLGMLSKPTAMVTPALAVVMDRWVLGRSWKQIGRSPWPWVWFALAIPCMVIATRVQPGEALDPIPLWIRPLIAADSLAFYLWKLVWPASLAVEYGHKPSWVLEQGWAYWTWILPVAVGVALWTTRKRSPLLLAGGMMVAIALSPVLGLTPFHFQVFTTVADHYMYIPMLGVSLAGGSVVARHESKTVLIVAGLVLAALGVRSFAAARVWNDNISLFTNALEVNPRSWLAADDLGTACVLRARAAGSVDEVIRWLEKAEDAYRQMVAIDRSHSRGTRKLVKTLSESAAFLGNAQRDDEAIAKCREFISITDGARAARMNLTGPAMAAGVRRVHGGALLRRGRISEAIEQFRVAVSLRPNDPAARKDLEVALEALNRPTTRPTPEPPTQPSKRD